MEATIDTVTNLTIKLSSMRNMHAMCAYLLSHYYVFTADGENQVIRVDGLLVEDVTVITAAVKRINADKLSLLTC